NRLGAGPRGMRGWSRATPRGGEAVVAAELIGRLPQASMWFSTRPDREHVSRSPSWRKLLDRRTNDHSVRPIWVGIGAKLDIFLPHGQGLSRSVFNRVSEMTQLTTDRAGVQCRGA